jgi:hypothetical protein
MADRTVSVKLTANVADYIAAMAAAGRSTRDLEKADRDLKAAHDSAENAAGNARVSEAKLAEVRSNSKSTVSQLAAAEEQHDANLRKLDSSLRNVTVAEKNYDDALKRSQIEQSNSSKTTGDEIDKLASRANNAFSAKSFLGLSLGLPAAAAIGAAGAGVAVAGIATAFAGLGVFIASRDDAIAQHWTDTMNSIEADTMGMGTSFKKEVSGAIDDVSASWQRLRPAVAAAVDGSAPAVRTLTGAITDFAENAMPGMVKAVLSSQPALNGLRSFMSQTGSGLSEFFANISSQSGAAGQGLSLLGGTVQLLLSRLGTLFANLAAGSAGPLNSLHVIVDQITSALNAMTAQGSSVLGFFTGFTGAASGMTTVISGVLKLVSLLPPQLGELAGSMTAVNAVASRFGLDAGKGFQGLGDKISAAQGPVKKFGTAVGGLAAGALNPAFLAVGILGVGLDLLGQKQQEAAANAADHAERVRSLTEALRASNGAIDSNVRATAVADLGNYKVADGVRNLNKDVLNLAGPQGLQQLQDGYLGNTAASDALKASLTKTMTEHTHAISVVEGLGTRFDHFGKTLDGNTGAMDETGFAASQLLNILNDSAGTYDEAAKGASANELAMRSSAAAASQLTDAQYSAKVSASSLTSAFTALNTTAGDTVAKGKAIIDILNQLSGKHASEEEALQAWNDHLRGIGDAFKKLDLKGHSKDLIDSAGAVNTTSEAGSKLQDVLQQGAVDMATMAQSLKDGGASASEVTAKLGPMRDAFAKQLKQLGLNDSQIQTLINHYGLIPDKITTAMSLEGQDQAQKDVSGLIEHLKAVPDNKGVKVSVLSDAARSALTQLGYQIIQLPDGTFQVFANTDAGKQGLSDFKNTIDQTYGVVHVSADDKTAQGTVTAWQQRADGTTGWTTLDARADPATGKLEYWSRAADGTYAWSTLDSRIDPATGQVQAWVRMANGTWGWVNVNAHPGAAEAAINNAARDRTATITVKYDVQGLPQLPAGANRAGFAEHGGIAKMASGGIIGMAGGGNLVPMRSIAAKVPPNTWRVVGDRMRDDEYYIPADNSARSKAILAAAMSDPKLGAIGDQIASGYATVGAMQSQIVVQAPRAGGGAGLSPQMVTALLGQMVAAVQSGLSQAEINFDPRGVATAGAKGRALNSLR